MATSMMAKASRSATRGLQQGRLHREVKVSAAATTSGSPRKDYSVSFFDAMKFNGPAPELINGRLAMIGLVAGAWQEVETGTTYAQQAAEMPLAAVLLLSIWVYASLVPICKGAKMEAFGMFTPRAELTNGRAAMLALAVLLALEDKAGVPFF